MPRERRGRTADGAGEWEPHPYRWGGGASNNQRIDGGAQAKVADADGACDEGVPPAGLEPATPGLGNLCSIHLSYGGVNTWNNTLSLESPAARPAPETRRTTQPAPLSI